MRRPDLRLPLAALAFLFMAAGGAAAQSPPPSCTAAIEGSTACIAGKLCVCEHRRAGTMTGKTAGHFWSCGVLRPYCDARGPREPRHRDAIIVEPRVILPVPARRPEARPGR